MQIDHHRNPVVVTETCWLYGEKKGLVVVAEDRDVAGVLKHVSQVVIPWSMVDRAKKRSKSAAE